MGRYAIMLAVVAALAVAPAAAMEMRAGPAGRVAQAETVDDDLYVAAGLVTIDGRVRGDVVAVGGTINAAGQIDGGLLGAGGTIDVSGAVARSLRVVGGTVAVRGPVGTDVVVTGGTVMVESGARIARDLAVAAGTVTVAGLVGRHARLAGNRVEIAGTIAGNAVIEASEIVIHPSAVITGDLTYRSEDPIQVPPGARIGGRVSQESARARPMVSRSALRAVRVAIGLADLAWMLMAALLLVALLPGAMQRFADVSRERTWASLGWGALTLVGAPVLVITLLVIIIGIPAGVLLGAAYIVALLVGQAVAGLALGQRLLRPGVSRYLAAVVGVLLVAVASHVPVVGWLVRGAAVAVGVGSLVLALAAAREPRTPPSNVPPPGWPAAA